MAQLSDESCPLLVPSPSTPLPKAQLFALCLIRLVEPIAFAQVFPYINEMIADLHLPGGPSRIAFYSGLAESVFAISSLFSIYHWARLSDVIGRRPVIFIGMLGMNLATLLFGLQRTLVGLLLVRCLGGFFSGNVAVIYSVLGELTDSTNQAIAFLFSVLLGQPLIGGTFSNPASTFPNSNLFHHDLFRTYPYFLPGCITSAVSLIGVILGYVLLEETLPSKRRGLSSHGSIQEVYQPPRSAPFTLKMLVSVPIIRAISLSGAGLSFTYTAFDVLFVLFCYSPIESGGLALSPTDIGFCLAISGFVACFIQLFVTPVLIARCDHIRAYNRCMSLWPFCFLTLPLLNIVARTGLSAINGDVATDTLRLSDADGHVQAMVWCGIVALLALSRFGSVAFGLSMILVKETAPTPESLGATNGLVQFAMSLTRSICPAFASSLFALLASGKFPSGYLWVVVMAGISYAWTLLGGQIERSRESNIIDA
ncbi:major facilitator superfamily domain-containing protein [Lactarius hatsudake]|nr:major facilitator superfamily domain-containing protein [Lactarius hatsudake]